MHIKNKHHGRYDFSKLMAAYAPLSEFVNEDTIDFSNSDAVMALNKAILKKDYHIDRWDIPQGFLCPPIPGRVDYIHYLHDLIQKTKARGLDIGTGANCIYPLLGHAEYGWSFVGSDINDESLGWAIKNSSPFKEIEIRKQLNLHWILKGIIAENEYFDFTMCNPPFHASAQDAISGNIRKWKNLGKKPRTDLNFGGKNNELWTDGGEKSFISKMIFESSHFKKNVTWFTTLVSKEANLPYFKKLLQIEKAKNVQLLEMGQGQKKSRILAWSF